MLFLHKTQRNSLRKFSNPPPLFRNFQGPPPWPTELNMLKTSLYSVYINIMQIYFFYFDTWLNFFKTSDCLESLKWEHKVRLVWNDPLTCARYFQQLSFNFTLSIIIASITLLTYVEFIFTLIITTFMALTLISTTTTRHLLTNIEVISTLIYKYS